MYENSEVLVCVVKNDIPISFFSGNNLNYFIDKIILNKDFYRSLINVNAIKPIKNNFQIFKEPKSGTESDRMLYNVLPECYNSPVSYDSELNNKFVKNNNFKQSESPCHCANCLVGNEIISEDENSSFEASKNKSESNLSSNSNNINLREYFVLNHKTKLIEKINFDNLKNKNGDKVPLKKIKKLLNRECNNDNEIEKLVSKINKIIPDSELSEEVIKKIDKKFENEKREQSYKKNLLRNNINSSVNTSNVSSDFKTSNNISNLSDKTLTDNKTLTNSSPLNLEQPKQNEIIKIEKSGIDKIKEKLSLKVAIPADSNLAGIKNSFSSEPKRSLENKEDQMRIDATPKSNLKIKILIKNNETHNNNDIHIENSNQDEDIIVDSLNESSNNSKQDNSKEFNNFPIVYDETNNNTQDYVNKLTELNQTDLSSRFKLRLDSIKSILDSGNNSNQINKDNSNYFLNHKKLRDTDSYTSNEFNNPIKIPLMYRNSITSSAHNPLIAFTPNTNPVHPMSPILQNFLINNTISLNNTPNNCLYFVNNTTNLNNISSSNQMNNKNVKGSQNFFHNPHEFTNTPNTSHILNPQMSPFRFMNSLSNSCHNSNMKNPK